MILEALYNGEIYPSEQIVPNSKEYAEASRNADNLMEHFVNTLDESEYALLEKMWSYRTTYESMACEEHYRYGFALGVLLMVEVYGSRYFK